MLLDATALNPTAWVDLGIAGAALFLVLVLITSMFAMQKQSIERLCNKIDNLVTSVAENNKQLTKVIVSNDKDQKQLLLYLSEVSENIKDVQHRVTRIDTRLNDVVNKKKEEIQ